MNARLRTGVKAPTTFTPVPVGILQRQCACGQHTVAGGECAECRRRHEATLQRAAVNAAPVSEAPPIVYDVLRSPGQPLDAATRAFMEPNFGRDFSQVRVHTDAKAAESARAVNALAYTVGKDVVFGAGQYALGTAAGKRLLAHELTHVVQQEKVMGELSHSVVDKIQPFEIGLANDPLEKQAESIAATDDFSTASHLSASDSRVIQRAPVDGYPRRLDGRTTLPYREANELLECIRIMGEQNAAFCRQQVLGESSTIATSARTAVTPTFNPCIPSRPLTWTDFTGTPSGSHSAFTAYDYNPVTTGGVSRIQAVFNSGRSFVRPQFGNPTNQTLNGCAANVTQCESFFPPGTTGGSFALQSTPSATCPASVRANPAVVAHSFADCAGIIATECQRVAQAESDRLLRHEQLHMNIACVLVGKANAALAAGASLPTIQAALNTKDAQVVNQYDTQTRHGCLAAPQATWETNVQSGLTAVTIP